MQYYTHTQVSVVVYKKKKRIRATRYARDVILNAFHILRLLIKVRHSSTFTSHSSLSILLLKLFHSRKTTSILTKRRALHLKVSLERKTV